MLMCSTSIACSDVILHARLGLFFYFFSDELRNLWQMLAERTLGFRGTPVENHCATETNRLTAAV